MTPQEAIVAALRLLFALLALAALAAFVVLPIWRMLRRTEEVEQVLKPFEPPPEEEIQIPVEEGAPGRKRTREEMIAELRADPMRTAQAVKQALREKRGGPAPARKR